MFQRVKNAGGAEGQRPRPPRASVSCSATIVADNRFHRGSLLDISSGGCRFEVDEAFVPGQAVRIAIEAFHALGGVVRWCRNGEVGIQFNQPISDYLLAKWQAHLAAGGDQDILPSRRSGRRAPPAEAAPAPAEVSGTRPAEPQATGDASAPEAGTVAAGNERNGAGAEADERRAGERKAPSVRLALIHISDEADICIVRNLSADGILARVYRRLQPGEKVQIELKAGFFATGIVARVQDYDIGVQFDAPIDLAEALSGPWAAESDKRPRLPRLTVDCSAMMRQDAKTFSIRVLNISQRGLKLETKDGAAASGPVLLSLPGLPAMSGTIRWVAGKQAGVLFNDLLAFEALAEWIERLRR